MSNQGCEGGLAPGQEGTVQWEVTRESNTEPRAAARPEPELLTNAPVSLRVLTGMSSLEQRWRWYGNEGSFHPTALPGVSCIRTLTEGFMVRKGPRQPTAPAPESRRDSDSVFFPECLVLGSPAETPEL